MLTLRSTGTRLRCALLVLASSLLAMRAWGVRSCGVTDKGAMQKGLRVRGCEAVWIVGGNRPRCSPCRGRSHLSFQAKVDIRSADVLYMHIARQCMPEEAGHT